MQCEHKGGLPGFTWQWWHAVKLMHGLRTHTAKKCLASNQFRGLIGSFSWPMSCLIIRGTLLIKKCRRVRGLLRMRAWATSSYMSAVFLVAPRGGPTSASARSARQNPKSEPTTTVRVAHPYVIRSVLISFVGWNTWWSVLIVGSGTRRAHICRIGGF